MGNQNLPPYLTYLSSHGGDIFEIGLLTMLVILASLPKYSDVITKKIIKITFSLVLC
jgi:hypothetical protein